MLKRGGKDFHLKELIKGSTISFAFKMGGYLLGYVFVYVVAQIYGAESLGIFSLLSAIVNIVIIAGKMGFSNAFVKIVAQNLVKGRVKYTRLAMQKILKITLLVNLVIVLLMAVFAPWIMSGIFNKPGLSDYLRYTAIIILPMVLSQVMSGYLQGAKKIWQFALIQEFMPKLLLLIGIVLAAYVFSLYHESIPVIAWIISWVLIFVINVWLLLKYTNQGPLKLVRTSFIPSKPMLLLALPMMLTNTMSFLLNYTDTLVLGMYASNAEVGIYNAAVRLAWVTSLVLTASTTIAAPKFAELFESGKNEDLARVVQLSTLGVFLASLPFMLPLMLFASSAMGTFGEEFRAGSLCLILLIGGQFVNTITGLVGVLLNMTGRHVFVQNLFIFITILNVGLNFLLIPEHGINGAALATAISLALKNLIAFTYVRRVYGFYSFSFSPLLRFVKKWKSNKQNP